MHNVKAHEYTSEITRQTTSMTQRMTIVTWLTPSKLALMGLNGTTKYAYANNAISEQYSITLKARVT